MDDEQAEEFGSSVHSVERDRLEQRWEHDCSTVSDRIPK